MKVKSSLRQLFTAATIFSLSLVAHAQKAPPEGIYQIDKTHSSFGFTVPHLVISTVEGKFKEFDGQITVGNSLASSKVSAQVAIQSIDTGVVDRDDHLRSADFFDAEKFPKMSFVSTGLKGELKSFKMTGDLTIKGTTRKVTFDTVYLGTVVDGYGQQKVAFEATTKINRKDFGLNWNSLVEAGPVVGDTVTIKLIIQGAKPAQQRVAQGG